MITLHQLRPDQLSRLAGLRPGPDQGDFVSTGAEMIRDATPALTFHEIRDTDGRAVGMFKLDPLYWQRHDFATPRHIGLRGLLIDGPLQGLGYGSAALAALAGHVRRTNPDREALVLTVNLRNSAAYKTYLRNRLKDRGQVFTGGTHGPQHVLWLDLRPGIAET
ncbi:GNAT family N-acetyltransferase [Paracoccus pacificus]|uniref:GNAT family N-acetyltransferase n=1 Tax=Paracoccus pacificus TaxID=1463598 RepID=A0ABW4RA05_9RHOB